MQSAIGTRSRGACHTCKKRKRRCDETRPFCTSCQQRGATCEGYEIQLRWGSGLASRGLFTGATLPLKDAIPPKVKGRKRDRERERHHQALVDPHEYGHDVEAAAGDDLGFDVNDSPSSTDDDGGFQPTLPLPHTMSFGLTPDPPSEKISQEGVTLDDFTISEPIYRELGSCSTRTAEGQMLFKECWSFIWNLYLVISSGHLILYSTTVGESPIASLFPQLVQHSDALFAACVTVQVYLSEKESSNFYKYNNAALNSFAAELACFNGRLNAGTMAAGLLLCTIGILQGTPWTMHIECMDKVFSLRRDMDQLQPLTPYIHGFMEVMGVMDLPTFVLGRKTPSLMIWSRLRQYQAAFEGHRVNGIEPVTGLPRSLVDLISNIENDHAATDLWLWTGETGELIQLHLWEAFRFAGILCSRRIQQRGAGSYVAKHHSSAILLPSSEVLVCRAIACLDAIRCSLSLSDGSQLLVTNALLYPIIVVGLEVAILREKPALKATLLQVFDLYVGYEAHNSETAWNLVLEAWRLDEDDFDIFEISRKRGIEVALF